MGKRGRCMYNGFVQWQLYISHMRIKASHVKSFDNIIVRKVKENCR